MLYADFQGEKISPLGFGAMRLPVIDGDDEKVDEAATVQMLDYAIDHGINCYATAWGYHGGTSERIMKGTLARFSISWSSYRLMWQRMKSMSR